MIVGEKFWLVGFLEHIEDYSDEFQKTIIKKIF